MSTISPQGYNYGKEPKSTNPFWSEGSGAEPDEYVKRVEFSESSDDTGTTYTETVTNKDDTTDTQTIKVPVAIKGDKGDKGDTGEKGADGAQGEKGEKGDTGEKGADGVDGKDGVTPEITATAQVSDTTGTPAVTVTKTGTDAMPNFDFSFSGLKGEKGDTGATGATGPQGETGATGPEGPQGDPVSKAGLVNNVSVTNENGVYTFKQTKYDDTGTATSETEIGTVEVPTSDNGIVEVKDTVVEDDTNGYDFHTITETQNDGTENEVGKFYLAQKQITQLSLSTDGAHLTQSYVDQDGNVSKQGLSLAETYNHTFEFHGNAGGYNSDTYYLCILYSFITREESTSAIPYNIATVQISYSELQQATQSSPYYLDLKLPTYIYTGYALNITSPLRSDTNRSNFSIYLSNGDLCWSLTYPSQTIRPGKSNYDIKYPELDINKIFLIKTAPYVPEETPSLVKVTQHEFTGTGTFTVPGFYYVDASLRLTSTTWLSTNVGSMQYIESGRWYPLISKSNFNWSDSKRCSMFGEFRVTASGYTVRLVVYQYDDFTISNFELTDFTLHSVNITTS